MWIEVLNKWLTNYHLTQWGWRFTPMIATVGNIISLIIIISDMGSTLLNSAAPLTGDAPASNASLAIAQARFGLGHVIARDRQRVPTADILDLVVAHGPVLESRGGTCEIEGPHAEEAFVMHRHDRIAVGFAIGIP